MPSKDQNIYEGMGYLTHEQAAPDRQGSEDGRATPLDTEADIGVGERESGLEEV